MKVKENELLTLWTPKAIIVLHRIIRNWYTGRWWVGCYIWYSKKGGCGTAESPPRCTKCNSPPINGQGTNHCIWWSIALRF